MPERRRAPPRDAGATRRALTVRRCSVACVARCRQPMRIAWVTRTARKMGMSAMHRLLDAAQVHERSGAARPPTSTGELERRATAAAGS